MIEKGGEIEWRGRHGDRVRKGDREVLKGKENGKDIKRRRDEREKEGHREKEMRERLRYREKEKEREKERERRRERFSFSSRGLGHVMLHSHWPLSGPSQPEDRTFHIRRQGSKRAP